MADPIMVQIGIWQGSASTPTLALIFLTSILHLQRRCWREQNRSPSRKLVHLCHLHSIARSHQICQQCYVTLLIFVLNDCIYIYAKKLENKVPSLTCPQSRSITGFQLISYLGNHISVTSMGKSIPASREPLIACRTVPKSDISTWH